MHLTNHDQKDAFGDFHCMYNEWHSRVKTRCKEHQEAPQLNIFAIPLWLRSSERSAMWFSMILDHYLMQLKTWYAAKFWIYFGEKGRIVFIHEVRQPQTWHITDLKTEFNFHFIRYERLATRKHICHPSFNSMFIWGLVVCRQLTIIVLLQLTNYVKGTCHLLPQIFIFLLHCNTVWRCIIMKLRVKMGIWG